jgi:glycosyltransferase involved in cell wall biosynthesis
MSQKTITVITSAYNEQDCIEELCARLIQLFNTESRYLWDVILVDNGSTDSTWNKMVEVQAADQRFRLLRLSRNFRMDGGLTAGLSMASGDAVVLMASDLQDPPELIPEFLRKWEEGYENVYMIVNKRHGTGPIRRFNSRLFYRLASFLTSNRFPENASDFRLIDRKVYEVVRQMEERNRFVRGLFGWVGFKSTGVMADRPPRYAGVSGAHSLKVIDLAFKGIFAHSYIPLKLITVLGLTLSLLSLLSLPFLVISWFMFGVPFAGFGTLLSATIFAFGLTTAMLGIVAEYVGLIYEEVKQRPNFVVSEQVGFIQRSGRIKEASNEIQ